MPNTSDWILGQHLIACTVTPYTLSSGGVLVPAAGTNIVAVVDTVTPELRVEVEDIRAVNDPQINEVPVSWGYDLRATVIMKGSVRNYFNWLIANYRYCRFAWRFGAETYTSYHVIKGWTGGVRGRSRNTEDLTLGPINVVGVNQFAVTT